MAQPVESMDIDDDFDNKENALFRNNVQPRTPCMEKGYEELDVSELNMKLRYSMTPVSSPMSKSYTTNLVTDSQNNPDSENNNCDLTQTQTSIMTRSDITNKSSKLTPLQIAVDQFVDNKRTTSVLRPLESAYKGDANNIAITVSQPNDLDDNLSLPSTSSSLVHTPEATTPTKEVTKNDGGSPIMRGIKSVLNMFRSSQSPIPVVEDDKSVARDLTSPAIEHVNESEVKTALASTPISPQKRQNLSKGSSPLKDSVTFKEDLEKELLWKDETTIIFSKEKLPIHKLFYPQPKPTTSNITQNHNQSLDSTVEYMDISYNDSVLQDNSVSKVPDDEKEYTALESDSEFVDCETTFTKNDSVLLENNKINVEPLEHMDSKKSIEAIRNNNSDELKEILVKSDVTDHKDEVVSKKSINITIDLPDSDVVQFINSVVPNPYNKELEIATSSSTMILNDIEEVENNESKIRDKNDFELSQNKIDVQSLEHVNLKESVGSICISAHEINETLIKSDEIHEIDAVSKMPLDMTVIFPEANAGEIITSLAPISQIKTPEIMSDTMILYDGEEIETNESKVKDTSYLINENIIRNFDGIIDNNVPLLSGSRSDLNINNTIELLASEAITNITNEKFLSKHDSTITDEPNLELQKRLDKSETIDKNYTQIAHRGLDKISGNADIKNDKTLAVINLPIDDIENETAKYLPSDEKVASTTSSTVITENTFLHVNEPCVNITIQELEKPVSIDNENCSESCEMKSYSGQNNTQTLDSNMDRICDDEIINLLKEIDVIVEAESFDLVDKMKICSNNATNIDKTLEKVDVKFSLDHKENQIERNVPVTSELKIDETSKKIITTIAEKKIEAAVELQNVCAIPDIIYDTVISSDNITSALKEKQDIYVEQSENHLNENIMLPTTSSDEITSNLRNKPTDNIDDDHNKQNLTINTDNFIGTPSDRSDSNLVTLQEVRNINIVKPNYLSEDLLRTIKPIPANNSNDVTLLLTNLEENQNVNINENKVENNINDIITINMDTVIHTTTPVDVNTDTKSSIESQNVEVERSNCDSSTKVTSKIDEKHIEVIPCSEEEVIVSEINSPYVSISVETESESIVEIKETISNKSNNVITLSPPITSKGYNFNFDTIDDPFATKTRISISPSSESFPKPISEPKIGKSVQKIDSVGKTLNKNRRKSQPEFRKSVNRKQNQSFGSVSNISQEKPAFQTSTITIKNQKGNVDQNNLNNCDYLHEPFVSIEAQTESAMENDINFGQDEPNLLNLTESAEIQNQTENCVLNEQSVESQDRCTEILCNTGTTSSVEGVSKNVFNLPEIEDSNFNPFATKLKISQSFETTGDLPKTSINLSNDSNDDVQQTDTTIVIYNKETNVKQKQAIDNRDNENINNTTDSSTTDEKNITVKEVHTDDEDTIEGPFLETGELDSDEKLVDFETEKVDMMNFSDVPAKVNEETGELFIDAETFDFLMNKNTNEVADSGKESLFLKFDPLFSRRANSDGVAAVLSAQQQRQSTPQKSAKSQAHVTFDKSAGSTTFNLSHDGDVTHLEEGNIDSNNTILSKPMMIVTPAFNPVVTPRNKTITPTNTNRRSMTYTSPAMAVIDRLLSLSSNNSTVNLEATLSEEQNEADLALLELREVLAVKEDHVQQLRLESEELKDRLSGLESQLRSLEIESEERLKRVNDLTERLNEKTQINKSMATVVEEYERTISSLIAETEQDKKLHAEERRRLINERDEQIAHLSSMEVSFSDLHSKYEKSKQVILGYKANEEAYKKSIKDFEENFDKMQSNYELLKQHATTKLNHANQELVKLNRAHESEVLKMNAMIKRKDLYITSLEESLAQKTKANEELTAICDELINKVG